MRRIAAFLILTALFLSLPSSINAKFDPKGPLYVKRVEFSIDKPRGLGRFEPKAGNVFKKGDHEVYIYIEITNCKAEKDGQYYYIRLAMDMDIYYEDGIRVYSKEDVNTFQYQSIRKNSDAYLWTKIDAARLKEGEYKVEMTIRDENSDKEAFALTRFKR